MRNQLLTRTTVTAAVIAIAMLMTLALLTTPGNNALGQNLPTIGFESSNLNPGVHEPDLSPYRVNVTLAPSYKVRYRESGETSWREHSRHRQLENKKTTGDPYNNCTGVPRFQNDAAESRGAGVEERELSGEVDGKIRVWCIRENGKLLTTKANTWPRMYTPAQENPTTTLPAPADASHSWTRTSSTRSRWQPAPTSRATPPATGAPAGTLTPGNGKRERGVRRKPRRP